mgnify:CR=1 FL=1
MDEQTEDRWYVVEKTSGDGEGAEVVYECENKAEAIRYAKGLAAMTENAGAYIVVNDDSGDEVWNNEGEWWRGTSRWH